MTTHNENEVLLRVRALLVHRGARAVVLIEIVKLAFLRVVVCVVSDDGLEHTKPACGRHGVRAHVLEPEPVEDLQRPRSQWTDASGRFARRAQRKPEPFREST